MYASLDALDLAYETADGALAVYLQTDHRDAATVAADASLSVVFAIARCLAARSAALEDGRAPFVVVYTLDDEPPPFLVYVVEASGAVVRRPAAADEPRPRVAEPRIAELEVLIGDAVAQLAAATRRREDLEPFLAGLVAYEYTARAAADPDDEVAYSSAIVTLGALLASVIVTTLPDARWIHTPGVVPFALAATRGDQALSPVDPFGVAKRFLDGDGGPAPSAFAATVTGQALDFGHPFAAFTRLRQEVIAPNVLEKRALAGVAGDGGMRSVAEALAREAASALRAWGLEIGDGLQWETHPATDIEMRAVGADLVALARSTYGEGHAEVYDTMAPFTKALERAIAAHVHLDARREDWLDEATWRCAVILERRVPSSAPRFGGRRFREVPNPFAPLLAIWATGYVARSIDERGVTLVVVTPPE